MVDEATAEPTPKVDVNAKAGDNSTINGKKGTSKNPTIPAGYIPIDTATSTWGDGSTAPSQDSVNHGLVIKDEKDNEWVWIPVQDVTVMCDTSNTTEYTLCGTEGDNAVKTKLYSKSEIISGITRTIPGTSSDFCEPDLVNAGYGFDALSTNYKKILGKTGTQEQLAQLFVDEYETMIESVSKYGGFYIGRYELSGTVTDPTEKSGKTLTRIDWYNLYNACRNSKLQASDKVKTQMIWGCQWDVTMNWLISSGAKTSDEVNKDSSSWGNYKDTSIKADDGTTEIKESGTGSVLNTGETTFTMANNIYGLAGNVSESTQEGFYNTRANRGGNFYMESSDYPASKRSGGVYPSDTPINLRFSSHFNNKIIPIQK